jgi:oligoendopeptidase F
LPLKDKINKLESALLKKRAERVEGYIDPYTKKFITASSVKMNIMISTNSDEKLRKACFLAREKLAEGSISEYIEIVGLRNKYAQILGYDDFYSYKVLREDGMEKQELFNILNEIYKKTKYAMKDVRKLEKSAVGLRKPWNFGYMMSGDFTKEEDQFFQFDEALLRWGKSFSALGIDYKGGTLQLDLLDRKGKWNNGFCHWPDLVYYKNGKLQPGSSNFTCNVVFGQVGSGYNGINTLFHEGGHAAHLLNTKQQDVCLNSEYAPMSMSWAETQSMFIDSLLGDVEWRTRYALNSKGEPYSFELFERKNKKLHIIRPLGLNSIIFVSNFEKKIYETKNLTSEKVKAIAKKTFHKYFDRSEDSLLALNVPHIYSWESSGSYHGYALAELAVEQWREYFYKKYGYIIDNPHVGKEMAKVWALGSAKTFNEFVVLATGKKLSANAMIKYLTASIDKIISRGRMRIKKLKEIKPYIGTINLNAKIKMVTGKKIIASNAKSFEEMDQKYKKWLRKNFVA